MVGHWHDGLMKQRGYQNVIATVLRETEPRNDWQASDDVAGLHAY
jgi:hypothetical protein